MQDAAVSLENVSIVYGKAPKEKLAVDDFSLDIRRGEIFGLLGPNGAGKTSLISLMVGLLQAKAGKCKILGYEAGSLEAKRAIGFVPQELIHHGFFSVFEILQYFSGYYGLAKNEERIFYLLDKLSLTEVKDKSVNSLSGGMKRRLLICKALVHSPKILLLDEPSAGVDIELRAQLWQFVEEMNRAGTTIVLTTHYLEEAQRLCDRVAIMNHGKLLSLDETGHLISSMAERIFSFELKTGKTLPERLRNQADRLRAGRRPGEWELVFRGGDNLASVMEELGLNWSDIEDFRLDTGSLEDAFLKIVGKS
jgi:ABC-2 type transport system ATP-binding protein